MEKRTVTRLVPCGLNLAGGGAETLVNSGSSIAETWAQLISIMEQQRQRDSAPQVDTSNSFDLSSDSASAAMPPQLPSFSTTVVADVDPIVNADSPGGSLTPICGMAAAAVLIAHP